MVGDLDILERRHLTLGSQPHPSLSCCIQVHGQNYDPEKPATNITGLELRSSRLPWIGNENTAGTLTIVFSS